MKQNRQELGVKAFCIPVGAKNPAMRAVFMWEGGGGAFIWRRGRLMWWMEIRRLGHLAIIWWWWGQVVGSPGMGWGNRLGVRGIAVHDFADGAEPFAWSNGIERRGKAGEVEDLMAGVTAALEHGRDDPIEASAYDAVCVFYGRGWWCLRL